MFLFAGNVLEHIDRICAIEFTGKRRLKHIVHHGLHGPTFALACVDISDENRIEIGHDHGAHLLLHDPSAEGIRATHLQHARPAAEHLRDELVSQATPVNSPNPSYTFNAPRSEHRGIELAADWKFYPGWRFMAAYTYLDEVYTEYVENITNGAVFSFNRAGNKIPGISPNELTARVGYDEFAGPLAGLGGFVEVQWKDSFYMDNANLLKAPGYELVNLNVHYKTDLVSDTFRSLNLFLEVRNVFDRTYVASANNIANTVTAAGLQNPASVLANTTGSIYAGSPRLFVAGMKVAFR